MTVDSHNKPLAKELWYGEVVRQSSKFLYLHNLMLTTKVKLCIDTDFIRIVGKED